MTALMQLDEVLEETVRRSGNLLKQYFGQRLNVATKESISHVVTEADLRSEKLAIDLIRARYPTHGIISEELGTIAGESDYSWVIDPLDGSSNLRPVSRGSA